MNEAESRKEGKAAGNRGKGRPKGSRNKTTTALKEAILEAGGQVGEDGMGSDGIVGYLRNIAKNEPRAFAGLLGKVLPMTVEGANGGPVETITRIELVAVSADGNA